MRSTKDISALSNRPSAASLVTLGLLLAAPCYALSRFASQADGGILAGIWLALSIFAFLAYRSDKRSAKTGAWRVPEGTLHLIALIGGWPGAFLAQRVYRHKTAKLSFQIIFWLIVVLHQFAAVDSLLNWRLTKAAIHAVRAGLA